MLYCRKRQTVKKICHNLREKACLQTLILIPEETVADFGRKKRKNSKNSRHTISFFKVLHLLFDVEVSDALLSLSFALHFYKCSRKIYCYSIHLNNCCQFCRHSSEVLTIHVF